MGTYQEFSRRKNQKLGSVHTHTHIHTHASALSELILKVLSKIVAENILGLFFLLSFLQRKEDMAFCVHQLLADNSCEMSSLIFFEK